MFVKTGLASGGAHCPSPHPPFSLKGLSVAGVCPAASGITLGSPVPHSLLLAEFLLLPLPLRPPTEFHLQSERCSGPELALGAIAMGGPVPVCRFPVPTSFPRYLCQRSLAARPPPQLADVAFVAHTALLKSVEQSPTLKMMSFT